MPCLIDGCTYAGQDRLRKGWCPNHYARWMKYGDPVFLRKSSHAVAIKIGATSQVCTRCGEDLPLSAYSLRNDKQQHRRDCKQCVASRAREYAKRHPEQIRAAVRRMKLRSFGLTVEQYQQMVENQNYVCLLCGREERDSNRTRLAVDHCHETGKVRGLLCGLCNRQLGWVEGVGLDKIANYLS